MRKTVPLQAFPAEDWSEPLRDFILREVKYLPADWLENKRINVQPPSARKLPEDIEHESEARKQRPLRAQAILVQDEDITTGMLALLGCRREGSLKCPATLRLLDSANEDLLPVLFYFKTEFNAARPSAYVPEIRPMFAKPDPHFPAHPSYPSGHAAQSRLFALLLAALFPKLKDGLIEIADDIAFNREVAGLHFRSDSDAGKALADQVFKVLMKQPGFARLLPLARAEWPENRDLR